MGLKPPDSWGKLNILCFGDRCVPKIRKWRSLLVQIEVTALFPQEFQNITIEALSVAKQVNSKMTKTIIGKLATKISGAIVCGGLISLGITTSAQALTAGISDFTGGYEQESPVTNGFRFRATEDLNVTALGVFDVGGDGFGTNIIDVGLWDDSGNPLGDVDVPGGTDAPILDGFRYQPLASSINLTAGNFYRVAAYSVDEQSHIASATPTTLNGIDSVQGVSNFSPNFSSPLYFATGDGQIRAGGNILFEDAVPVPFELSPNLGIIILGGIWGVSRLRKKISEHQSTHQHR